MIEGEVDIMNTFEQRVENLEDVLSNFMSGVSNMQNALTVSNQNALDVIQQTNNKLAMQSQMINTILHVQEEQSVRMQGIEDKFEIHMANEMINPAQEKMIKKEVFNRVVEFLDPDSVEWVWYSKAYFGDLYSYVRKNHYMMNPIACTKVKNYDDVMEGVMTWYPNETKIKEKADKRRKARKLAK